MEPHPNPLSYCGTVQREALLCVIVLAANALALIHENTREGDCAGSRVARAAARIALAALARADLFTARHQQKTSTPSRRHEVSRCKGGDQETCHVGLGRASLDLHAVNCDS